MIPLHATPSAKTPAQILRDARALIDTPGKWTQYTYARTALGTKTDASSPRAVCYCASGAINRVESRISVPFEDKAPAAKRARKYLSAAIPGSILHVPSFNDRSNTTHDDIMALFDRAILSAEKGQDV